MLLHCTAHMISWYGSSRILFKCDADIINAVPVWSARTCQDLSNVNFLHYLENEIAVIVPPMIQSVHHGSLIKGSLPNAHCAGEDTG